MIIVVRPWSVMAMACGNRLASSELLRESFSGAGPSGAERVDAGRASSSQLLHCGCGLMRTFQFPALSVVSLTQLYCAGSCCVVIVLGAILVQ